MCMLVCVCVRGVLLLVGLYLGFEVGWVLERRGGEGRGGEGSSRRIRKRERWCEVVRGGKRG